MIVESAGFGTNVMTPQSELSVTNTIVIVVDDDAAVRNALRFSLEVEGFAVRDYPGGIELLNDREPPEASCLVIDHCMPGMNGLDVVGELRHRHVAVPAILITSHPNAALTRRAATAGVPIVEKPLLGDVLIQRIRHMLLATDTSRVN
jgi:FixJ family two-component response regulator